MQWNVFTKNHYFWYCHFTALKRQQKNILFRKHYSHLILYLFIFKTINSFFPKLIIENLIFVDLDHCWMLQKEIWHLDDVEMNPRYRWTKQLVLTYVLTVISNSFALNTKFNCVDDLYIHLRMRGRKLFKYLLAKF